VDRATGKNDALPARGRGPKSLSIDCVHVLHARRATLRGLCGRYGELEGLAISTSPPQRFEHNQFDPSTRGA